MFYGCTTANKASGYKRNSIDTSENSANFKFSEPDTWLLGFISLDRFRNPPHSEWYLQGYQGYQPDNEILKQLAPADSDNLQIIIVLGTWCSDSRREVPHFMKIIDQWKYPAENIIFIGVDDTKAAPVGDFDALNIERVPTFIFLYKKAEAGRIIENPVTSLEQDIKDILSRDK